MKKLIIILSLFSIVLFAQETNGKVFKEQPTKPYEDTRITGLVVVKNSMYGLSFSDQKISNEIKEKVKQFFYKRPKGYTDFKTYKLTISVKNEQWYIDDIKL